MKDSEFKMNVTDALARLEQKLDDNTKKTEQVRLQATKTNGKVAEQEKEIALLKVTQNDYLINKEKIKQNRDNLSCLNTKLSTTLKIMAVVLSVAVPLLTYFMNRIFG
jgi:chromosome segregation ATPase